MKLEDQVITLEQAKRLQELGITNSGCFSYLDSEGEMGFILSSNDFLDGEFGAFTVAELGVMLPEWIVRGNIEYRLTQWHNTPNQVVYHEEWRLAYRRRQEMFLNEIGDNIKGQTEAQARAAMLIYLLEKGLITPDDVNKRLAK